MRDKHSIDAKLEFVSVPIENTRWKCYNTDCEEMYGGSFMKRILAALVCLMLLMPVAFAQEDESITLSFLGDCSLGDSIQYREYENSYHSVLKEKGYDWPFSLVRDVLAADDLTIANLEVVLTTRTRVRQEKMMNLIGDPAHVNVLTQGSIEVMNTANNHAWDYGAVSYHEMLSHLDEAGVAHFGSLYPNTEDGSDLYPVIEVKGIKLGFIGFSYPQDYDRKKITNRINKLREQGAQIVIVSLHWGTEEQSTPHSGQQSLAKYCIDEGADVVYGHHPHVLQTVQFYKGKPIFYSTGNFTFGAMANVDPDTGIFQLTYDIVGGEPILRRFAVVPCRTQGSADYRPYILTDAEERMAMLKKLVHRKNGKNLTTVTEFFVQNGYMEFENGIAIGE